MFIRKVLLHRHTITIYIYVYMIYLFVIVLVLLTRTNERTKERESLLLESLLLNFFKKKMISINKNFLLGQR